METPVRVLKDHIVEGDLPQNQLTIEVIGPPGVGGANHKFLLIYRKAVCKT